MAPQSAASTPHTRRCSLPEQFGGHYFGHHRVVSVSMERKTILLYNLDDPENALELAFQQVATLLLASAC